jgi:hypothetical protein
MHAVPEYSFKRALPEQTCVPAQAQLHAYGDDVTLLM